MNENFGEENGTVDLTQTAAENETANENTSEAVSETASKSINEATVKAPAESVTAVPVYRSDYSTVSDEDKKLKSDMHRLALGVALPFLILCAVPYMLDYALKYLIALIFGYDSMYALFTNEVFLLSFDATINTVLFTLPFLILPKITRTNLREVTSFNKPKRGLTLGFVMLGIGVCSVSNIASSYFISLIESLVGMPVGISVNYGANGTRFLISLFTVGILPAIIEEFALRGVVLGTLRKYFGDGVSVIISAALFGLMHGNIRQIPFAMGVGLILGFAVCRTGSILPAMLIHAANNLFTVLLQYALRFLSPTVADVCSSLYNSLMIIVGVCGFLILIKTDAGIFRSSDKQDKALSEKLRFFLPFAPMIVYYAVQTLDMIRRL